jgi:16S rRNA (cytidine1402-2'-O)-methyltransferase
MTLRGIRILQEVAFIAAEDTRHTRKLLTHFDIHPERMFPYHQHNLKQAGEKIQALLLSGLSGALVSDAGMPGVSDPGELLIRMLAIAGIQVEVLPGPSAFITALVGSGMPVKFFAFIGFLPVAKKERRHVWERFLQYEGTLIFYEAPHRLRATLEEMYGLFGDRSVVIVKELSKMHETYYRGDLKDHVKLADDTLERGEFVIIVEGAKPALLQQDEALVSPAALVQQVEDFIRKGMSKKEALKEVAKTRCISRRVVYQALLDAKVQSD